MPAGLAGIIISSLGDSRCLHTRLGLWFLDTSDDLPIERCRRITQNRRVRCADRPVNTHTVRKTPVVVKRPTRQAWQIGKPIGFAGSAPPSHVVTPAEPKVVRTADPTRLNPARRVAWFPKRIRQVVTNSRHFVRDSWQVRLRLPLP